MVDQDKLKIEPGPQLYMLPDSYTPLAGDKPSDRRDLTGRTHPCHTPIPSIHDDCDDADPIADADAESEDDYSDLESNIPLVKTFVRAEAPQEILLSPPQAKRRGVSAKLALQSHLCIGGGVMKGSIEVCFNHKSKKNKSTQICAIKLDCVGIEAVKGHEPKMFFSVAQDVLTSGIYLDDLSTTFLQEEHIKPGQCIIPFEIQLPLDIGPGSFDSKDAELGYNLSATLSLINTKRFPRGHILRMSHKVRLYPCLDPGRILVPSVAPIDAVGEARIRFGGKSTLKAAARMHRSSWTTGQAVYVDVSVTNDSTRDVHKIDLELVRHIVFYKAAAASSAFQSIDQRVPEKVVTKVVSTSTLNNDKSDCVEWTGVKAGSRQTKTCLVDVPTDELSVSAGRYFGVTYIIRVLVCTKGGGVDLELPITVVHVNSTDVIPSSAKAISRMIATYAPPAKFSSSKCETAYSPRLSMPTGSSRTPRMQFSARRQLDTIGRFASSPRIERTESPKAAHNESGIQCDLRRALSLDYQKRFAKLDISAEQASYTHGVPLARRSIERKRKDFNENLAHRLHREQNRNPSFYDIL